MQAMHAALATGENVYRSRSSPGKLQGRYYTPEPLVARMLEALRPTAADCLLDPSCGDGSFLRGAVAAVRRSHPGADGPTLARRLRERLVGFDIDADSVRAARRGLHAAFLRHFGVDLPPEGFHVYRADVLRHPHLGDLLRQANVPGAGEWERLLVVGNPPYVEAKRLSRDLKRELKTRYPDALSGAPDLYLYFLQVCLGWLRERDRLAFVLPNRVLVNANAQRLRERLLREHRLERLWFATRTDLFDGAAVYPVVLFASGARSRQAPVEVAHLGRCDGEERLAARDGAAIDPAAYGRTAVRAFFAPPACRVLAAALDRLLPGPGRQRLGDVLDIRWSVSFHRAGLRERYVTPAVPPSPHARRFLGGGAFAGNGEVSRYAICWKGGWIDYDEERLRADGNSVPAVGRFERPKIVICQNGRTLRAAYDDQGFVLKDTFLCGTVRDADHPLCRAPRAIVGLLCSMAVHFFYSHVFYGGHVGGGYLHFLRSFLVDAPIGRWTDEEAAATAELVLQREKAQGAAGRELEDRIEERIGDALGLAPEERRAIRAWAEADANWRARDRIRRAG